MTRLSGRDDIRDVATKYEAVSICLVDPRQDTVGAMLEGFPPAGSLLNFDQFFERLYEQYDRRFLYAAPILAKTTRRLEWDPESPVVQDARAAEYNPRLKVE
jgi:hypothetical protein